MAKRDRGIFSRNGVLYGRVKNDAGKWIAKTLNTSDPVVARERFRELERCQAIPSYRASSETTFGSAAIEFLTTREIKGCAEGTMQMYDVKLRHLKRLLGADTPLRLIDAPKVDKYIATRLQEGSKKGRSKGIRNTIGKELTALRGVLKTAKRNKKFPFDLDEIMPTEWANDYEPRRTALTAAQASLLITALASPAAWIDSLGKVYEREVGQAERMNKAAMVALMIGTGARLAEACRCTRGQIDLKRGIVYFAISKTRKKGKREKWVPITPATRPLLEQVLAATQGRGQSVPMFDRWSNMTRDLKKVCKALDIPRVTANDLRRTHSNWLVDAGVALNFVADVLGHVDSRMVEKVYGKLRPEQLRDRVLKTMAAEGVH